MKKKIFIIAALIVYFTLSARITRYVVLVDENGNPTTPSAVSTNNSTTTPLSAGGVFVGSADDISDYSGIALIVSVDAAGAANGLVIEYSFNAFDWHVGEVYTVLANSTKFYTPPVWGKYFRVMFTNGAVDQTNFHLHVTFKRNPIKWSSHNIDDPIKDEDDAELVKAVLTGKANGEGYLNVRTTSDGDLKISDNSSGLSIAQGNVTGHSFIHKFGAANDFDISDGFITVFDGAEDGAAWELMNYVYSTIADIDGISSTEITDEQDIEIQGLDILSNIVIITNTLSGQTPVAISSNFLRVFRMRNVSGSNLSGHVICFVTAGAGGFTGGVPNNTTNIRAIIHPENNQTEMSIFTIPNGKIGYMRSWYASTAGAKRDSQHTIKLLARPTGQVFQLKHKANIAVTGTSYIHHEYVEPEIFAAGTDLEIQMDSDQDIAGVAAGFDIILIDE